MKLNNLCKLALLNAETTNEAEQILVMYKTDYITKPSSDTGSDKKHPALNTQIKHLEQQNTKLKETIDSLKGAPKAGKRSAGVGHKDGNSASVSTKMIKDLIRSWHEQQLEFTTRTIADYFDLTPGYASVRVSGLFKNWGWLKENYKREGLGRSTKFVPKHLEKKRGDRVWVKGQEHVKTVLAAE